MQKNDHKRNNLERNTKFFKLCFRHRKFCLHALASEHNAIALRSGCHLQLAAFSFKLCLRRIGEIHHHQLHVILLDNLLQLSDLISQPFDLISRVNG
jgi:hypothetical protein